MGKFNIKIKKIITYTFHLKKEYLSSHKIILFLLSVLFQFRAELCMTSHVDLVIVEPLVADTALYSTTTHTHIHTKINEETSHLYAA